MDTTKINTVEWFFGYGGNHLGLKRIIPGLRLVAACEIEGYAVANMVQKMEAGQLDSAPIWTDAKTFPGLSFHGLVDLFIASYPCQGFSCAGKRGGSSDPRFLWPWVFRFVVEARPSVVFFENVEGHVSLGLSSVISDLEEAGYCCTWEIFSAEECGAAHRRKRVFILGYDTRQRGGEGRAECPGWLRESASILSGHVADPEGFRSGQPGQDGRQGDEDSLQDGLDVVRAGKDVADAARQLHNGSGDEGGRRAEPTNGSSEKLGDANSEGLHAGAQPGIHSGEESAGPRNGEPQRPSMFWPGAPARPGEAQHDWEPRRVVETKRGLGGGINGRASNVDRLRLLGNGVYPACAGKAFVTLAAKLLLSESNSANAQTPEQAR